MSHLEREIRRAQRRLWLNLWLRAVGWCLAIGIGAWIVAWVLHRLLALQWPMFEIAVGLASASVVASAGLATA